jgi:hypothetical protein
MKVDLQNIQWSEFELEELFNIYTGGDLIISRITKGNIPIISHSILNNGVADWTSPITGQKLFDSSKTISLADRGNFYAYTQKVDFYIGTRVKALEAKFENCNKDLLQFICPLINKQSVKFSYGNNATGGIDKLKILLPIDSKKQPDFGFMRNYIRLTEQKKNKEYQDYILQRINILKNYKKVEQLNQKEWSEFFLKDIFTNIQRGKRLKKGDHKKGNMPYISSSAMNNGIDGYVSNKEKVRIFKKCLSLANSGSVGATFYHPYSFVASDHITKLENEYFNEFIYLFIASITSRLSEKYSFNREINDNRIQREKVLLPVDKKGQPDYNYMENYIKKLEYEKLTKYIERKTPNG